jgi:lipoprotein-anchoring transpeptidase ErfK/SrfK
MSLSRRGFLRSAGMFGVAALGIDPTGRRAWQDGPPSHWDGAPLGRILLNVMTVYDEPSWRGGHAGATYYWSDIVEVEEAVPGEGLYPSNGTWLRVPEGYIYSSWVQPVQDDATNPAEPIGEGGAWAMVTVPITPALTEPSESGRLRERMVYSTVHRVLGVENGYYRVEEIYGGVVWMKAAHMRIIPPEEVAPIAPDVPPEAKRIEVSIGQQRLRAYENDEVVFESQVSTGTPDTPTPMGEYRVTLKRHGQRMVGGQGEGHYNLPAIPWICYFTRTYAATHGTYWHNDYGRRHSNGCVNLPPDAAKWVFRWTTPVADYGAFGTSEAPENGQPGTPVIVKW